jgi:hypothetical protein
MADLYLSAESEDGRRLTIAPMSSAKRERCADPLSDWSGYFLTEEACSGGPFGEVRVLARIEDDDAALRIARLFNMS